jgi:YgiT-type zinc finger domain-containing protein
MDKLRLVVSRSTTYTSDVFFVVENVKAEVCQECRERYFHAATLDAIDRLLENEHPVIATLPVEVVSL